MLFNNFLEIKELFVKIKQDIIDRPYNFSCFDQPYIVYNSFKYDLYNNKLLKSYCVNNYYDIKSNKIIHHFPRGPGLYKNKLIYMEKFLTELKQQDIFTDRQFTWEESSITFLKDNKMNAFGDGKYEYIDSKTVKAFFGYRVHLLQFNSDYTSFISVREGDSQIVNGSIIEKILTIQKLLIILIKQKII